METLKLNDFLSYRFLSEIRYAPGGERAALVVSECNEEENSYESRLWLYDGTLRQLTDLGKERGYLWEDAEHILFPAVRSAKEKKRAEAKEQFTSYYRLDVRGGEAIHAFTLPFAASGLKKAGEGYVAIGHIDAAYPDYYKMTESERADVAKHYEEEKDYEVLDEIPFWSNGGGMTNKMRAALFLIDAQGNAERITDPLCNVNSLVVFDDVVYYLCDLCESKMALKGGKLCRLDTRTGESSVIAEYPEWMIDGLEKVGGELWMGASKCLRYREHENPWFYRVDLETGALTLLHEEEYSMYGSVGSDCRYGGGYIHRAKADSLYMVSTREDSALLYRLGGDGECVPVITKKGSIDSFDLCEERAGALLIAQYDNRLQELYTADLTTGEITRVSSFNEEVLADKYVADYQPLSVESDGWTINGYVLLPKDYDPAKSYPAVLDIHGGPKTAYGPVFYHEMQVWANMGYFVFFCNPKGSDGRDNAFADICGEYGQTDYRNIMDFTDAVLAAYPQIDKKRVCVTGGSYGGFMTNWIIGHTDRFCAAASQRSISNWLSFYGVSDIGYFFGPEQCDGTPFTEEGQAKLWEQSPLRYASNAVTPTLFIHSDEDYRCPLPEGLQMYTALVDRGIPARLCMFHGENHELSRSGKPKHRLRRLTEITNWFEKYAKE